MNKTTTIQYSILIIIGILLNYQFLPIGDYCVGLLTFLKLLFFGLIFLITFIAITVINLKHKVRLNKRFDLIPSLLFIFFSLSAYVLIQNEYDKFWTKTVLTGKIESQHKVRNGNLKLYEDGTFDVCVYHVDFSCTYTGSYRIYQDSLKLNRDYLEKETEYHFTTEYRIYSTEKKLKPLKKEFREIVIQ